MSGQPLGRAGALPPSATVIVAETLGIPEVPKNF